MSTPCPDEAAFVARILAEPGDRTARLVFADWLEERGRGKQAAYLRAVRSAKLAKHVVWRGADALHPLPPQPPRVPLRPASVLGPHRRSARCAMWAARIAAGWTPPKHARGLGYESAAGWYGVTAQEYLTVLAPLLWGLPTEVTE